MLTFTNPEEVFVHFGHRPKIARIRDWRLTNSIPHEHKQLANIRGMSVATDGVLLAIIVGTDDLSLFIGHLDNFKKCENYEMNFRKDKKLLVKNKTNLESILNLYNI